MDKAYILEERQKIVAQLIEYVPKLAPFFQLETTLKEYSMALYNFPISEIQLNRQELIKKIIRDKIKKLFGDDDENNLGEF